MIKQKHILKLVSLLLVSAYLFGTSLVNAQSFMETKLPTIKPGKALSLQNALELADKQNLTLAESRSEIEAASGRLKSAWGGLLPDVYAKMNYVYYDHSTSSTFGTQTMETRTQQDLNASLSVTMPLISARQWLGIAASQTGLDLVKMNGEQIRQEMLFVVASAYFQTLSARSLIDIYKSQLSAIERHLKVATFRHRSGIGQRLDVTRSQSDWISTHESLIQAHYALEAARDTLRVLLRLKDLPSPKSETTISDLAEFTETEMFKKASSQRYDLKAVKLNSKLAKRQHLTNYMQFVPTLSASWQIAYQISDPPASAKTNFDRSRWFGGLVLSVPLFDFNFYGSLKESRAAKVSAKLKELAAKDNAKLAVRQAIRRHNETLDMVRTSRQKANITKESERLAETYYENGSGSSLGVVDARRMNQSAEVDLIIKKLQAELAKLDLLRATGTDIKMAVGK